MTIQKTNPAEIGEMMRDGRPVDLIDVRTPAEFNAVHAEGARLAPLGQIEPAKVMSSRRGRQEDPVFLICKSGSRSEKVLEQFDAAGFENVACVEGGTDAWEQAGLPVVRGRRTISLERQVRIGAGALVLIGVMLGVLVHPWLLAIAAFVGAGLMFAGIADFCGMALVLARMPWNRGSGVDAACTR
jgi:rhodanese-related sulfurtransferase